jgi:hypothetical protein
VTLRRPVAALAAATLLAGCGGGGPAPQAGPAEFSAQRLQTASCTDWKRLSLRERMTVIDQLEEIARGPHDRGATLPDQKAYDVIDDRCGEYFARGFLLYEMYNRAASFYRLTGDG